VFKRHNSTPCTFIYSKNKYSSLWHPQPNYHLFLEFFTLPGPISHKDQSSRHEKLQTCVNYFDSSCPSVFGAAERNFTQSIIFVTFTMVSRYITIPKIQSFWDSSPCRLVSDYVPGDTA
jgi:hypothetical protein